MMPLAIVLIAIAIAFVRGGSLRHFAALDLRFVWLAFAALALQVMIFSPIGTPFLQMGLTPAIYILSMALLIVWVVLNRSVGGMLIVAAGLVFNFAAIVANGGYMPVGVEQARFAGKLTNYAEVGQPTYNSVILPAEQIRVWLLTDILAVPAGVPLANVFSIGDLLLFMGIGFLCYRTMCSRNTTQAL